MKTVMSLGAFLMGLAAVNPLMADKETVGSYTWSYWIEGDSAEICCDGGTAAVTPYSVGADVFYGGYDFDAMLPTWCSRTSICLDDDYCFTTGGASWT